MNWHKVIAALSVGGAVAAGALSGGTIPAVVAGAAAALGTFAVRPSQVSTRAGRISHKIRGAGSFPKPDARGQIADDEEPRR